jgi:glycosyltransferase involved in cell wall biosynthesis
MKICAMLRVRNESRWLPEVLTSIAPLCSEIHLLDDHSTDDTADIARSHGAIVYSSPFEGLDETRDKNWLLDQAMTGNPQWLLMIDGDEILEPGGAERLCEYVERGHIMCLSMRVLYLWDRRDQYRADGVYGRFWRPSMWRTFPGQRFRSTRNGGNFHCGNTPHMPAHRATRADVALLHTGYMLREDRVRKYEWYRQMDPANRGEDEYRHVVIGDVFPAESRFRWAGPLELRAL